MKRSSKLQKRNERIIYLLVAAIGLLVGCTPEEETWVQAGFTTDKESYEIGDLITLTNTSTAENARIAVCNGNLWVRCPMN